METYCIGTAIGPKRQRRTWWRTIPCSKRKVPGSICGRMSTPMNTCGDCAKVGNEPGLLGYKSLYLSVRELWRIIKASCESKEPHACAWRPIADLSDDTWGGSRQTGSKR